MKRSSGGKTSREVEENGVGILRKAEKGVRGNENDTEGRRDTEVEIRSRGEGRNGGRRTRKRRKHEGKRKSEGGMTEMPDEEGNGENKGWRRRQ